MPVLPYLATCIPLLPFQLVDFFFMCFLAFQLYFHIRVPLQCLSGDRVWGFLMHNMDLVILLTRRSASPFSTSEWNSMKLSHIHYHTIYLLLCFFLHLNDLLTYEVSYVVSREERKGYHQVSFAQFFYFCINITG